MEIYMGLQVMSLDSINTVDMTISLTAEIRIKWLDYRLRFFHLVTNHDEVLSMYDQAKRIWNPLEDLIIGNTVVGDL